MTGKCELAQWTNLGIARNTQAITEQSTQMKPVVKANKSWPLPTNLFLRDAQARLAKQSETDKSNLRSSSCYK